ncbi:hypothetical protein [Flavobacterium hiemivividum]|uniref:Uncharacterized protein n=1 Tax=Flavobacterium hiemivividum TaxID=2541734 RepID=A0A4R5CX44_9FLAO|nr:hypothetical protein [Flavobacterium hiemivividum]TDE05369.1 hypothetical protein E0F98_04445 [Flavobacterium hiemivividum]
MEISIIYNNSILLQFIGAIFSIILTVTVIYIKRENERNSRREYYETANQNTDILGDITIKIDEELPSESYIKLMTMWGLQPLLLLVLLSFIDNHNIYPKICWFFGLLIFTLLHEFLTALKYSDKTKYQILMLIIWVITFWVLSLEKNQSVIESSKHERKITVEQQHTTAVLS